MSDVDERALSRRLREEVEALEVPSSTAQGRPHDLAGIRARGRRRRLLRVHGARAGSVLVAAAVAGALVVSWPTPGARTTAPLPAGPATAPSPGAPEQPALRPGPAGPAAVSVQGLAERSDQDPCAVPGTLVRTAATSVVVVCGSGPAAVVTPLQRADWFTGYPSSPGLQLVDGVPAWVSQEFFTEGGDRSGLRVVLPSLGVRVLLFGTPEETDALLGALQSGGAPTDTADRAARSSDVDPTRMTLTTASGDQMGLTRDTSAIDAVVELLDDAVRADSPGCFPALADTAQLDLLTAEDSDPATGPVSEYTYLVVDTTGSCDLVYSSTGAVLEVDSERFTPLMTRLLDTHEQ